MDLQQQLGEWYPLLSHVFATEWMQKLGRCLGAAKNVVPAKEHWFRAFQLCPPSRVKVVICLQDPYINGEADGLAMSSYGRMTPSLEVVFGELNRLPYHRRTQTHLDDWAAQGVLLINAVLTTRMGKSRAHQGWGWENFTKEVMRQLRGLYQPIVFLSWGKDAQEVTKTTATATHNDYPRLYLKTVHPQAQNYDPTKKFIGCNHFLEANRFLVKHGVRPIWWGDPMIDPDIHVWFDYLTLLNHQYAEVGIPEIMRSYPAISDRRHPFDDGLGQGHNESLPF